MGVWFNQDKFVYHLLWLARTSLLIVPKHYPLSALSPDVLGVGRLYSDFLNGRPYNDS